MFDVPFSGMVGNHSLGRKIRSPRKAGEVSIELFREQYRAPWGQALGQSPSVSRSPAQLHSPSKFLFDRVAELQSPMVSPSRSPSTACSPQSAMTSPQSLSSPGSPYSPKCLDAKRQVCEQRLQWLQTQADDIELQMEKLSAHRADEVARLEVEAAVQLDSMELDLEVELYAVRVSSDLEMHELRTDQMELFDRLEELRLCVTNAVKELDQTHAKLEQEGLLPDGFREQCARNSGMAWNHGRQVMGTGFREAAGHTEPLTEDEEPRLEPPSPQKMADREEGQSDEEWRLLCARHLVVVSEERVEWLRKRSSAHKVQVKSAIRDAVKQSQIRIQQGLDNKNSAVDMAKDEHVQAAQNSRSSCEKMSQHILFATELLQDLDRVKESWRLAASIGGQWSNNTSGFEIMLGAWDGSTIAGCKSVERLLQRDRLMLGQAVEGFSPLYLATPRVYIRMIKSDAFADQLRQISITGIHLSGDVLSFVENYPGGKAQWTVKISTGALIGTTTNMLGEQRSVQLDEHGAAGFRRFQEQQCSWYGQTTPTKSWQQ